MCCDSQCRTATEQRQKANQQNPLERASNWSAVILVNDTSSDIITFYVYLFGMRLGSRTYTLHTFTRTRGTKQKKKNETRQPDVVGVLMTMQRRVQTTATTTNNRICPQTAIGNLLQQNNKSLTWTAFIERSCIFNTACSVCSKIDMAMARWRRRRPYHILPFHFFFCNVDACDCDTTNQTTIVHPSDRMICFVCVLAQKFYWFGAAHMNYYHYYVALTGNGVDDWLKVSPICTVCVVSLQLPE